MNSSNEKTLPTLGERLKLILSELQLQQTAFAAALGISANYVYLLTSGKKAGLSEPLARLMESTYGYSAHWILTGRGHRRTAQPSADLKAETIDKVRRLSPQDLRATAAFLRSLEGNEDDETIENTGFFTPSHVAQHAAPGNET